MTDNDTMRSDPGGGARAFSPAPWLASTLVGATALASVAGCATLGMGPVVLWPAATVGALALAFTARGSGRWTTTGAGVLDPPLTADELAGVRRDLLGTWAAQVAIARRTAAAQPAQRTARASSAFSTPCPSPAASSPAPAPRAVAASSDEVTFF